MADLLKVPETLMDVVTYFSDPSTVAAIALLLAKGNYTHIKL
jgi:hypothetical protein